MLETFTLETFSQRLNSKFLIKREADDAVELELIEAEDLKSTPKHTQFSIIFRGPADAFLPQATYPVEHEELGAFPLFIVPIQRDQKGFYYQAIFSRTG